MYIEIEIDCNNILQLKESVENLNDYLNNKISQYEQIGIHQNEMFDELTSGNDHLWLKIKGHLQLNII